MNKKNWLNGVRIQNVAVYAEPRSHTKPVKQSNITYECIDSTLSLLMHSMNATGSTFSFISFFFKKQKYNFISIKMHFKIQEILCFLFLFWKIRKCDIRCRFEYMITFYFISPILYHTKFYWQIISHKLKRYNKFCMKKK